MYLGQAREGENASRARHPEYLFPQIEDVLPRKVLFNAYRYLMLLTLRLVQAEDN